VTHYKVEPPRLGCGLVSGCRLLGQQLSLILSDVVYEEQQESPSELVTDQRDGRPSPTGWQLAIAGQPKKTNLELRAFA
jgi:hypothetical protein